MTTSSLSPLRYPGGKQILTRILRHLIQLNNRSGGVYVEPYAGGAGAALALLFGGHVNRIIINDADPHIFAFWDAVLNKTSRLVQMVRDTPLTIEEWHRQRSVYHSPSRHSQLRLGFASFYLNRCNRSGIIATGGVIGGLDQTGKWKQDARFNREDLVRRIERIAKYRDRISISNHDAIDLLRQLSAEPSKTNRFFVYLDPPYYGKGSQLYLDYYGPEDHAALAEYLKSCSSLKWLLSYDNARKIRELYSDFRKVSFDLGYSASKRSVGSEVLIFNETLKFPSVWKRRIPQKFISRSEQGSVPMPT
ncbi:DNA adenine methylase [Myxococcaceae bacterium GXIMD 01537]